MLIEEWMDWIDYAKQLCEPHRLAAKMMIISSLKRIYDRIPSDSDLVSILLPELKGKKEDDPQLNSFKVNLCMQILALLVELTEDFAAICFAYYKARNDGKVPKYLRDFGRDKRKPELGHPDIFYDKAEKSYSFVADMIGKDPINDIDEVRKIQRHLIEIGRFRKDFKEWYISYKHGQRVSSMSVFDKPTGEHYWGLLRIPLIFDERGNKIIIRISDLIRPYEMVDEWVKKASLINELYHQVRKTWHEERKIFEMGI